MADKEGAEQDNQKWMVLILIGLDAAFAEMTTHQSSALMIDPKSMLHRPLKVMQSEPGRVSIGPLMPDCGEDTSVNASAIMAVSELKNNQLIAALDKAIVQVYSGLVIPSAGNNGAGVSRFNPRLVE